jgi:hypothetical protein
VITVCFAYATIVPFICVIGFGYFVMAYCVYKHQLLFVFIPKFETGGTFFTTLMGYTLTGINFANITFVGYLGIKNGWSQAALVFCLLPLVEGYRYYAEKACSAARLLLKSTSGTLRLRCRLKLELAAVVILIAKTLCLHGSPLTKSCTANLPSI